MPKALRTYSLHTCLVSAKIISNHFQHHAQIICGKLAQKVNFTENMLFTL